MIVLLGVSVTGLAAVLNSLLDVCYTPVGHFVEIIR